MEIKWKQQKKLSKCYKLVILIKHIMNSIITVFMCPSQFISELHTSLYVYDRTVCQANVPDVFAKCIWSTIYIIELNIGWFGEHSSSIRQITKGPSLKIILASQSFIHVIPLWHHKWHANLHIMLTLQLKLATYNALNYENAAVKWLISTAYCNRPIN